MKIKRITAAILLIIMTVLAVSCAPASKGDWLPYSLQFGQSYDDFAKALKGNGVEVPELKEASANDGFITDLIREGSAEDGLDFSFLHSETINNVNDDVVGKAFFTLSMPSIGFSFNQDKKLYEIYCMFSGVDNDVFKSAIPEMIEYYNEKLGGDQSTNTSDYDGGFNNASWETDKLSVSISEVNDMLIIVIHSFEYDLDS